MLLFKHDTCQFISGEAQVQRAGGEGFSHNEQNPDNKTNRILQIWALPEKNGLPASYKFYKPKNGLTRLYGGPENQAQTFSSSTTIDLLNLNEGDSFFIEKEMMTYIAEGSALLNSGTSLIEGDLNIFNNAEIVAQSELKMILINKGK